MRLKKIILGGLLLSLSFPLFAQNVAMGHWRTHFASTAIHSVFDEGNRIYAASSTGLFYVDLRDNTLSQISKIQGLSGIDISKAGYHKPTGQILVCYADGNIDILDGARVINIPDIKRKNISGDKTIHTIFWKNQYAYLACGFGIVVLDMSRREIKDSYFIGENSTALSIYDVGIDENLIYAATAKGIYYASSSSPNLSDYKNWTLDTVLPASKQQQAFSLLRKVGATYIAVTIDTQKSKDLLYRGEIAKKWSQWDETNVNAVSNICVQSKDFLRITKGNAGYWEIGLYDFDFNLQYVKKINFGDPNRVKPREALTKKEVLWIGQGDGALNASENKGSSNNWYAIQGPSSNDAYALSQGKHSLLMCAGGLALDFRPEYRFFQCSKFEDNTWSWFNANIEGYKDLRFSTDATSAQEDPLKEGHIFISSALNGLWEFQDNQIVNHYTPKNSALQYFQGDSANGCRINSIAFDYAGNLWISNSGAVDAMVVKRLDGTWQSYSISTLFSQEIGEIMVDYWNQKWILGRGGKLFVFKEDAPQSKILSVDINRGNELEVSMVNCMIEDEDGFIWIGTERGVRVIYTNAKMFENPIGTVSSVECKTIPYVYDDKVVELLKNETVTAITIDGANQKWIGTQSSGVYLMTSDGSKEIHHFTTENSPILSDRIIDISVNRENGEVFIGTDKGLIAYRGVGTVAGKEKAKALVFPNPVKPDYQGLITIKNLPFNADVKITDLTGNLIYQTKAVGGQAVWDGYNFKGKRPNSGVLIVFASNADGSLKVAGKIFFVK